MRKKQYAILRVFGRTIKEKELLLDLREKIYLVHRVKQLFSFSGENSIYPRLTHQKAIFEFSGYYLKDFPIYEFVGLE